MKLSNLGNVLKEQGDIAAAIASYTNMLKLKPDYPEAYYNLGNVQKSRVILLAIGSYKTAISLKPNYYEAYNNLGNAFKEQGDLEQSLILLLNP